MSWKTVNKILSFALIDQDFCQKLLIDPLGTIDDYNIWLTQYERQVLSQAKTDDLMQLSLYIMEQLAPEQS
jgi:hypothetical protein